jgi:regulatory protein YycI of two-component signal transduction system YycFG
LNWKRAKSILIAMFVIINIFLSYQLFSMDRSQYKYIEKRELEGVIAYLESKNILVKTEIPDRVLIIPPLNVRYRQFDEKKIQKQWFPSGAYELHQGMKGFEMTSGDLSLTVKNNIYLTYTNRAVRVKQQEVSEKKCLGAANRFLDKLKLNNNKYIKLKELQKGYVRLILGQQYRNIPVEGSQIEIIATEEGVVSANISWFEAIQPTKRHNITTPVVALLTAYEKQGKEDAPVIIHEIKQGYYFKNTIEEGDGESSMVLEGAVAPMWVIKSEGNEIYYINAYNEKIEDVK